MCASIADESPNPRQKVCPSRAGEHGSMYHICPAESQIQIIRRKAANHLRPRNTKAATGGRLQLRHAILPGPGGVNDRNHRFRRQRRFHLREAGHHRARLAGHA